MSLDKIAINFSEQLVVVYGKGKKEREVYFNTRSSIWLKRYLEERKDNEEALFVTLRAPHRMGVAQMRYVINRFR